MTVWSNQCCAACTCQPGCSRSFSHQGQSRQHHNYWHTGEWALVRKKWPERGFVHRENLHNFTWTRSNGNRFSPNRLMINSLGTSNEGKKESTLPNIKFSHRLLWSFPVESESWEEHFENIQPSLTKSYFHCPSCPHEFYITPIIRPAQKKRKSLLNKPNHKFPTSIKDVFNPLWPPSSNQPGDLMYIKRIGWILWIRVLKEKGDKISIIDNMAHQVSQIPGFHPLRSIKKHSSPTFTSTSNIQIQQWPNQWIITTSTDTLSPNQNMDIAQQHNITY